MSTSDPVAAPADLSPRAEELVRSAYAVMARVGGHRLSLQDIADEAGVSKGLLLYHFKTKEQLLRTTMRWALVGTAARIRERVMATDGPRETITALVDAIFVDVERNHRFTLVYLDLLEHSARQPTFGELSATTHQIVNGLYAELVADGVRRGAFVVCDVDDAAAMMRAYIEGTLITWLQDAQWRETHERYRARCEAGLLLLLGAAEAPVHPDGGVSGPAPGRGDG